MTREFKPFLPAKDEDAKHAIGQQQPIRVTLVSDIKHPPMTNSEINQAFPAKEDMRACATRNKAKFTVKTTGARKATCCNKYLIVAQGRDVSLYGILVRPFLHGIWLWNNHSYEIGLKNNNCTK